MIGPDGLLLFFRSPRAQSLRQLFAPSRNPHLPRIRSNEREQFQLIEGYCAQTSCYNPRP